MQSPAAPTQGYSPPPRSSSFPLWGKIMLGCGAVGFLLLVLIALVASTAIRRNLGVIQTGICMRNVNAISQGLKMYSQDYDDTLPPATVWMDSTRRYLHADVDFRCPVLHKTDPSAFGYALNPAAAGKKRSRIAQPENTPLVYDSTVLTRNAVAGPDTMPKEGRHQGRPGSRRRRLLAAAPKGGRPVNQPGNIVAFADGHVQFVPAGQPLTPDATAPGSGAAP